MDIATIKHIDEQLNLNKTFKTMYFMKVESVQYSICQVLKLNETPNQQAYTESDTHNVCAAEQVQNPRAPPYNTMFNIVL